MPTIRKIACRCRCGLPIAIADTDMQTADEFEAYRDKRKLEGRPPMFVVHAPLGCGVGTWVGADDLFLLEIETEQSQGGHPPQG